MPRTASVAEEEEGVQMSSAQDRHRACAVLAVALSAGPPARPMRCEAAKDVEEDAYCLIAGHQPQSGFEKSEQARNGCPDYGRWSRRWT